MILIRGGGDLASGVALRLVRSGFAVAIAEIAEPLAVRRLVSFSEAIYAGRVEVERVAGVRADGADQAAAVLAGSGIPVMVDPDLETVASSPGILDILAVVDGRMLKRAVPPLAGRFVVGLGPGFTPGENCDAVVETMRGHHLGRVYWDRPASADTGVPDGAPERILRAPAAGIVRPLVGIGALVGRGETVAEVEREQGGPVPVLAGIAGAVRGMIRPGIRVAAGVKIGDVDPRGDPALCGLVSDKALAVGGGVLEALLSRPGLRIAIRGCRSNRNDLTD
jgi:xanthine dehydrogenase accessory factor